MSKIKNWIKVTESQYPWEREALDLVRKQFPEHEPYRAWANFEFIADDGSINEVDLLVFSPQGFFLVEIKSHLGSLEGDSRSWTWRHEGRAQVMDNPLFLANLKAKKLASLLSHQRGMDKHRVPFIDALVFCSGDGLESKLEGNAAFHVCLRDTPDKPGIMAALKSRDCPGLSEHARGTFNRPMVRAISRALDNAGIRPSRRSRQVGDYELEDLLDEGPGYQDFLGRHVGLEKTFRRVRIYLVQGEEAAQQQIIRRAAEREFRLLQALEHRGVLRAMEFTNHELGPAIIFQHHPDAVRLDHYVIQQKDRLTDDQRLDLIRQIGETVGFAHRKHIVHRALSPRSVLVLDPESRTPRAVVTNWQLGYRQTVGSKTLITHEVTATIHVEQLSDDATRLFMAPETMIDADSLGEHQDIFSLGAICYHLFTGQAPAENLVALAEKLRNQRGLRVSAVVNGAPEALDELVQYSTDPDVSVRMETVQDFLEHLDKVEDELTTPTNQLVGDPTQAKPHDVLPGGYEVLRKLGTGSTAVALLVAKDDREYVMKIAVDSEHNDRIAGEGEVLSKFDDPLVVRSHGVVTIKDRVAILMDRAGEKTLGQRIRQEGRLSLDLLQRFGEDLLEAVDLLERKGIDHRDLKPDNIGVSNVGRGDLLHLVLFDFSLSRCSADNIRAGTPGYLDPFLPLRKPPRWDLQAERFAAAVTLYQMATGAMPTWHDGVTDPSMVECEATIEGERFFPNLRVELTDFFAQALRRNARERFDNAQEMLKSWQNLFKTTTSAETATYEGQEDNSALLNSATAETNIAELGLGALAVDALDRINVVKVADLLKVPGRKLARMRGVGNKTRKRILAATKQLRKRLEVTVAEALTNTVIEDTYTYDGQVPKEQLSIDMLVQRILKAKARSRNATENTALEALLGLDDRIDSIWPSQGDVAPLAGVSRGRISQILTEAQKRWVKDPAIKVVRDDIATLLEQNGGVMSSEELCQSLRTARGSLEDDPLATRRTRAVTRAAVETENQLEIPKFQLRRDGHNALIATDPSLTDYAVSLGHKADEIAKQDPLVPPVRVVRVLREITLPPEADPVNDTRLVRLAAAASQNAAVSSRQELYPKKMDPARGLKLSQGALVGSHILTIEQIGQRVQSRYPLAAALPGRPKLDKFLADAGLELAWNASAAQKGAYVSTARSVLSVTSISSTSPRYPTLVTGRRTPTPSFKPTFVAPEVAEAEQFEDRLNHAQKKGLFLAMTAKPNLLDRAQHELTTRFDVHPLDLETVFVESLHRAADEVGADWPVVVAADAAPPNSSDWRNLNQLIASKVIPEVEQALTHGDKTILVYHANWLARYSQIVMLSRVYEAVQAGTVHGVWLLLPASSQTDMPLMDGQAVPVITTNQWAAIPDGWCQNLHRSSGKEVSPVADREE